MHEPEVLTRVTDTHMRTHQLSLLGVAAVAVVAVAVAAAAPSLKTISILTF